MSKHRATPEARMGLFSAVLYGALPSTPSLPTNKTTLPCPTLALRKRTAHRLSLLDHGMTGTTAVAMVFINKAVLSVYHFTVCSPPLAFSSAPLRLCKIQSLRVHKLCVCPRSARQRAL
jgi:hypothetical protein